MNKLIGYTTLDIDGEKIPLKMGSFAIECFLESVGIELHQLDTLYEVREQQGQQVPVIKNLIGFTAAVLWSSAHYAAMTEGREPPKFMQAYEWIDALGGVNSEALIPVHTAFWESISGRGADRTKKKGTAKPTKAHP